MGEREAEGEVAPVVRGSFEGENEVDEVVGGWRGMMAVPFEESAHSTVDCFEWHCGGGGGGLKRERGHWF